MHYSLDDHNRLRIRSKNSVLYPRGRFSLDQHNRLVYWLNEPQAWRCEHHLPAKIVFHGRWQLSSSGLLEFHVDKSDERGRSQPLAFRCKLTGADSGVLVFSYKTEDQVKTSRFALLKFSGSWGSDEGNRLQFYLSRRKDRALTFQSAWTVNDNQQVVCRLESFDRSRGRSVVSETELSGYWEIVSDTRLRYILGAGSRYVFEFRVQIESVTLRAQKGMVKFRLGAGLRRTRARGEQVISLFGAWKFNERLGLVFEMDYGPQGKRNGLSVTVSRALSKKIGGETFIRLSRTHAERMIEAGITIPF